MASKYKYMSGFGGHFESEAIEGALPQGMNSPQKCPFGLYAEQLSGTAFTIPRHLNQRSWLYRIRPGVCHSHLVPIDNGLITNDFSTPKPIPNQLRWHPAPLVPEGESVDFIQGLKTVAGAGDPKIKTGTAIYVYTANTSMKNKAFYNSDGDLLIVPQQGTLDIQTEFGFLEVKPEEICVIQRGITFSVNIQGDARGYVCEIFNGHFELPSLGPIGANGLANPRDFLTPVAAFEGLQAPFKIVTKFAGNLFEANKDHSPFNVVAWHGNYAPYKYDLTLFCPMNTVLYDHADPSIFTVLTNPTTTPGVAACDFVIFPPRWIVAEKTFRPPYYHRNCMSEYMGMIKGFYEAKPDGFLPGGGSLHSCMTAHGPDANAFFNSIEGEQSPFRLKDTMAFMFESHFTFNVTEWAQQASLLDENYIDCWAGLSSQFKPS